MSKIDQLLRYLLGTDQLDQTVGQPVQRTYDPSLKNKLEPRNSSNSNASNIIIENTRSSNKNGNQEFKPVKSFYIIGFILLYGGLLMAFIIPLCYTINFFETVPCCRKSNYQAPFEIFHNSTNQHNNNQTVTSSICCEHNNENIFWQPEKVECCDENLLSHKYIVWRHSIRRTSGLFLMGLIISIIGFGTKRASGYMGLKEIIGKKAANANYQINKYGEEIGLQEC